MFEYDIAERVAAQMLELPGWLLPALLIAALLTAAGALGFLAFADWSRYQRRGTRRGYRRRKSAHERFATARAAARSQAEPLAHAVPRQPAAAPPGEDDDLLRDLLGQ
ncbi:MAG: hypothetical protein HC822_10070 [Oscillochloris sp.]|nr:hypothetical protein [Oscillochloris sp.]